MRSLRRRLTLVVAVATAAALLAGGSAPAKKGGFKGFATCTGPSPGYPAIPSDGCVAGAYIGGGVFVAKKRDRVRYKLCVTGTYPDGDKDCFKKRTREAREQSFIRVVLFGDGIHKFKWRVPGRGIVAKAKFDLGPGD